MGRSMRFIDARSSSLGDISAVKQATYRLASLILVTLLWLPSSPLAAQPSSVDEQARTSFEAGKAAYDEGQYEAALTHFQRSYELSQKPQLQYNLGLAYDRLRRDGEALEAFEAYLAFDPNAERAAEVRARVAALKQAIDSRSVGPSVSAHHMGTGAGVTKPADQDDDRSRRKRRWWIAGTTLAAVAVIGVTAGVLAGRSSEERLREPNTGVRVEALSWH